MVEGLFIDDLLGVENHSIQLVKGCLETLKVLLVAFLVELHDDRILAVRLDEGESVSLRIDGTTIDGDIVNSLLDSGGDGVIGAHNCLCLKGL